MLSFANASYQLPRFSITLSLHKNNGPSTALYGGAGLPFRIVGIIHALAGSSFRTLQLSLVADSLKYAWTTGESLLGVTSFIAL